MEKIKKILKESIRVSAQKIHLFSNQHPEIFIDDKSPPQVMKDEIIDPQWLKAILTQILKKDLQTLNAEPLTGTMNIPNIGEIKILAYQEQPLGLKCLFFLPPQGVVVFQKELERVKKLAVQNVAAPVAPLDDPFAVIAESPKSSTQFDLNLTLTNVMPATASSAKVVVEESSEFKPEPTVMNNIDLFAVLQETQRASVEEMKKPPVASQAAPGVPNNDIFYQALASEDPFLVVNDGVEKAFNDDFLGTVSHEKVSTEVMRDFLKKILSEEQQAKLDQSTIGILLFSFKK